ncbi:MAG: T9SS type A sorting domain-containing protein [Fidelibacterota bacterium]
MLNTVNGIELTELLDWPAYSQIPFHIGDHIRVDDRGTKWITTKHHGFFAIFNDGSLLNNGLGFQSSNSGLLSDLVYDVAIDEINQFASFATLNGISILDVSGFPDSQFLPMGDVNGDGQSDVTDVVAVIFFILGLSDPGTINQFEADMNQDDIVDIVDVVAIVNQILNPSLICQTPPSYIRIQENKFECELISDTEVIAYHLFFESHNRHYIEVLSDGWEVFFNESELIAIFIPNTESGKYVNLKLKINDIVFTGGRGCNRLGNCVDLQTPTRWTIHSPYPNPFNPVVSLRYDIPETGDLRVSVYDLNGRLVDTIFEGIRNPGEYTLRWNATQFASGVYFVKFKYQDDVRTEKILLLK